MKKILTLAVMLVTVLLLAACWPAEVGVTTEFNANGSGTRTFVVDIMDDTLSTTPIGNPDDPEGVEEKGAVINDKHIDGGLIAIQTWLEENAPDFITVHPARVEGYHRYFTFSYDFSSFKDFLEKYETLVNLSPTISWDDFEDSEKPQFTAEGFFEKKLTFKESKVLLEASLDWAVDGIFNDIYNEQDLAGFVTKADISVIANVVIQLGDGEFKEERHYDANRDDGTDGDKGVIVFVESEEFEVDGKSMDMLTLGLTIGGAVLALLAIAGGVFFFMKKRV